jgi:hydroxyethylthiazole kinase-like sugar kinase family protein
VVAFTAPEGEGALTAAVVAAFAAVEAIEEAEVVADACCSDRT